jgi:hypothetical protein
VLARCGRQDAPLSLSLPLWHASAQDQMDIEE